jgi:predicted transcriptional regulator
MARKQLELTEAEWAIIGAVWEHQPCAAPTVQEALQNSKGLLKTERIRNLILYRPAITRQQAQKREVMRTVKRAFNGALTPMMQFLLDNNSLSAEQLNELEALIKTKRSKAKDSRK